MISCADGHERVWFNNTTGCIACIFIDNLNRRDKQIVQLKQEVKKLEQEIENLQITIHCEDGEGDGR